MSYVYLIVALLIEVVGTSFLKCSNGFSNIGIGVSAYVLYGISIYIFSIAIKSINLAIADTIWQGLGVVLITLTSYAVFNEPLTLKQIFFIVITLVGVIGIGLS